MGELKDGSSNDMHNCNFFDFDADGRFKRVIIWMAGTNPGNRASAYAARLSMNDRDPDWLRRRFRRIRPGRAVHAWRSRSCSTTRRVARTRRSRAILRRRRSSTRSSGRRRRSVGATSTRVHVRVRQPRRLLARAPHLHDARRAGDGVRGRSGRRAEPRAARAMIGAGWEVASHGWRWIDYGEDGSRRGARAHAPCDRRDRACVWGPPRRLVHGSRDRGDPAARCRGGGFLDSDSYADELPYWTEVDGHDHLVILYARPNDFKFLLVNGFVTARVCRVSGRHARSASARGGADVSVGLHCRIVGRPGRAPAAPLPQARRDLRRRLGGDARRHRAPLARNSSSTADAVR